MNARFLLLLGSVFFLVAAAVTGVEALHSRACPGADAPRKRLVAYHDSGRYMRELAHADGEALAYIQGRARKVSKPAIVLDIDETSLSNWPEILANDFADIRHGPCDQLPKGPCGREVWQGTGGDEGIIPTVELAAKAQKLGVAIFFITGRHEPLRDATARNLNKAGFHGWKGLALRPGGTETSSAADYKIPEREKIEAKGYRIIANIGDQPSDLAGGHAERSFLLPNPFYTIP